MFLRAFCFVVLVLPVPALAENALALEIAAREVAASTVRDLERQASRILYIQARALLSVHGDWPEERQDWGEGGVSSFVYQLDQVETRFAPDVVALRRNLVREGSFTDEERDRMSTAIEAMGDLIAQSGTLLDLIRLGDISAANTLFRDDIRQTYEEISATAYTIGSSIDDSIRSLGLQARLAE